MRLLTILLAGFAMMISAAFPAHAQLKVDVVGERYIPLRIAIPNFDATGPGAAEAAAQMMQVIRNDLTGSAVFNVMDPAAFIEKDLDIALQPRFPDWTVIDAQALVESPLEQRTYQGATDAPVSIEGDTQHGVLLPLVFHSA